MARARIVIVNYNGADFIEEAIESALAQTLACDVFVVDNASTDGSPSMIRAKHPDVKLLEMGANLGFGVAANAGAFARNRDYDYVAFLNPDARARSDWIELMMAWMEGENVDVGSSIVSAGESQAFFVGGRWRPFLGTAFKLSAFEGEGTQWVSGCAMVARRDAFERIGGFNQAYFLYYEDADLSLRASKGGMRLGVLGQALVDHPREGRSSDLLGSLQKRRIGLQSKGRLVRRFVPAYALPSALLFQCFASPAINGASLREYPALVRAFISGFLESPGATPPHRVAPKP